MNRSKKLLTLYNNHLKSHYGDDDKNGQGKMKNDLRRLQQAEMISNIVSNRMRTTSKFIILGDMNDSPNEAPLKPMLRIDNKKLFNALKNPTETRSAKTEKDGNDPTSTAWTHRYKPRNKAPEHKLFDQIWLSSSLKNNFVNSFIDRRKNHGGDGSDHDPAWIELNL